MRLKDRIAIVVGAGQSPGEGMGNGYGGVTVVGGRIFTRKQFPSSERSTQ